MLTMINNFDNIDIRRVNILEQILKFDGIIQKLIFGKDNFKIYSVFVDENKYPNLKYHPEYKTITITGDTGELDIGTEYHIESLEQAPKKYGYSYLIKKIYRDKPKSKTAIKSFLHEVLNANQAETLYNAYPNIVELILDGKDDIVDLNKLKGIKEKSYAKIKTKIINDFRLVDLISEYSDYGISMNVLKKLHTKYNSIESIKEKLKDEPYKCLCDLSGISFKKADAIIIKINPDMLYASQRLESCIDFVLKENESQGNTYMDLKELHEKCSELTSECINFFLTTIQNNVNLYLDKVNKRIAKQQTYECEVYIAEKLKEMLSNSNQFNIDYDKYNKDLTSEQSKSLLNLCKYNVSLLIGFGGTGKTFTTKSIINMLKDNNKSFLLLAPTGKASKVLSEYTNEKSYTIHRGLGYKPQIGFEFNENNPLLYDVIVVDEFSMVDIFLFKNLLKAIDVNKTKILFIGDSAQIPSVSAGNISFDMTNSDIIPKTILTRVFRYKDGGLAKVASDVREGKKFIDNDFIGIKNFGINKDYNLISVSQEESIDKILKIYKKLIENGKSTDDIMVLSAMNKNNYGTTEINKLIQQEINPRKEDDKYFKYGDIEFRQGDKVIQVVNNYKARKDGWYEDVAVFNGNTGKVIYVDGFEMKVDFGDNVIVYEKDDLEQLRLGYCISIHKSQGSQNKNVILLTPKSHKYFLNKNLLYTGLTRASERVYHICSTDVINTCLHKNINLSRKTFLKELLT